ncbi:MAG TPA: hypothetical protein V6D14_19075 [Coleofasciculaceae cyanobacterium]
MSDRVSTFSRVVMAIAHPRDISLSRNYCLLVSIGVPPTEAIADSQHPLTGAEYLESPPDRRQCM